MIKAIDIEATCSAIWPSDPAVDEERSDLEAYKKAFRKDPGAWRELIKPRDGEKITEFVVGVIPPGELCRIEDQCKWGSDGYDMWTMRWLCFLFGLRDIRDGPTRETTDKGTNRKKTEVPKITINGIEYVDRGWLGDVFARDLRDCAMYIGSIAWHWNQLGEGDVKK